MKQINMSYPITWLKESCDMGDITESERDKLIEVVQTFGIYEAAVRRELAEAVIGGYEYSEESAHEAVLFRMIRDLDKN